jgi:hypothetical protein
MNQRRNNLTDNFTFKGQEISNLMLVQLLKYFEILITAKRIIKLETIETKFIEMKIRFKKTMESPLLIIQKIDVLKTFVFPILDFMMLNGDIDEKQLIKMVKYIRRQINKALKVRGLPIECYHIS